MIRVNELAKYLSTIPNQNLVIKVVVNGKQVDIDFEDISKKKNNLIIRVKE